MTFFRIKNKTAAVCLLVLTALFFTANPLFAQRKITIKLASLVPENTIWGTAINRLAADFSRITSGEVEVIVFHGGTAGTETEVLRRLRMDQIQAAVLTSIGMGSLVPQIMTLSYPFLIRNNDELNAVMNEVKPDLDNLMQQTGFVTLAWASAGWVNVFSKGPVIAPADLRTMRLGTNGSDERFDQAFKTMGFSLAVVPLNDIVIALNANRVDSLYMSPIYAASSQAFGVAKNMMSLSVSPFMGGIIINNATWRKIPAKYRDQLLAACRRVEREIFSSTAKMESDAVSVMVQHGLVINELTQAQAQEWYNDVSKYENTLGLGSNPVFNRDYYIKIKAILEEYRRTKK